MTFKIDISQVKLNPISPSEPKQWKWNKMRHFPWEIFKFDTISCFVKKYSSISKTFKVDISRV